MDAATTQRVAGPTAEGEAGTPFLELDGFSGPLALLLTLARTQQIDLAHLPLASLIDQLATALQGAGSATSLGQKGDWVVMTAWLLWLRSRLLLPAEAAAQQAAETDAHRLRDRLLELQAAQALALWLERRPQLGRDVFARGRPELLGTPIEAPDAGDIIAFLWASLEQFADGAEKTDTTSVYRPPWHDLCSVLDARNHILRLLADMPDKAPLIRFVPPAPAEGGTSTAALQRQSAVASTLMAGLELAREGVLLLEQAEPFAAITLRRHAEGLREPVSQAAA